MHIRILAGKLDRHAGSHVYHYALAKRLAARGHSVSVVCFASQHEPLENIDTIEFCDRSYENTHLLWRLNPVLRYIHYCSELRACNLSRPDLVIGGEHLLLRSHHSIYPDIPWIYLPHSLTVRDEIAQYRLPPSLDIVTTTLYRHIQQWALQNASCTLRFTNMGCEFLRSAYRRLKLSRFVVNPVGIDAPTQVIKSPRLEQVRLLVVGSLIPRKGIDIALDALGTLSAFQWHLNIVGSGGERQKLESQARMLGIRSRISFVGYSNDPTASYENADLLLFPSRSESLGLVVLEAMSHAVPCLGFRSDGVNFRNVNEEIITHRKDGLLGSSLEDFRNQLAAALQRPDELVRLGKAARETMLGKFSWPRHLDTYDRLFEELVGRDPSGAGIVGREKNLAQ